MDLQIGDTFEYEGVTLEVVEQDECNGCFFRDFSKNGPCFERQYEITGCCSYRDDNKLVIFKKV